MSIKVRAYQPGDEEAILACWNDIFPDPEAGLPPRDMAWWKWYYAANPAADEPRIMLAFDEDKVVGQYAGLPLQAQIEGRGLVTVVQAVDLMVRPEYRRLNIPDNGDPVVRFTDLVRSGWRSRRSKAGLFVFLGRRYYERWCGADKDLMTYGYAVPAWRIGNKYLGYEVVETTAILFKELAAPGFTPLPTELAGLEVVTVDRFGPEVDALWAELSPDFRFALVRDHKYLNWRYTDRPGGQYKLFLARDQQSGALRGLAVFRVQDFIVPGAGLLVEWLAPPGDEAVTRVLLGAAEQAAAAASCPVLATMFPPLDSRFLDFQNLGFRVKGTTYNLGVVTFYRDASWLRERWYYTLGDSDLA